MEPEFVIKKKKQTSENLSPAKKAKVEPVPMPLSVSPKFITEWAIFWEHQLMGNEAMKTMRFKQDFDDYFKKSNKLFEHPRTKMVSVSYSNGGKKTYRIMVPMNIGGTTKRVQKFYGGITDKLRTTFYPDTSDNPIEKSKRTKMLGGRKPLETVAMKKGAGSPCPTSGSVHGTTVHNQVEKITKMINRMGNFDYYQKKKEVIDPCTAELILYCIDKKWFPLRAEFIIFDEDIEVATAIDLLLVDLTNWKLVMIELKNGFEDEEYCIHPNDVKFPNYLHKLTNCPLNRHLLQLVSCDIILNAKYNSKVDEMYVVRLCPKIGNIEVYGPSLWCLKEVYRTVIYQAMLPDKKQNIIPQDNEYIELD